MPRYKKYPYDTYRGRSGTRHLLTGIIVVLLILLGLAVGAFFLLQGYMVYTDDGQARLELPFLQKERTEAVPTPSPEVSQDIVIVTNPPEIPTPTPSPTPTPAPTVTPAPVQPVTNAVWLLRGHLLEGSWKGEMGKAGANAVLFNLKADDGTLGYVSALPRAAALGTTSTDRRLNTLLTAAAEGGTYTVARISCFKDNKAPQVDNTLSIKANNGYNWRDNEDRRWLNVSLPAARDYVVGVIKEAAALGVNEILLEHSGYPTLGNLSGIQTGEAYDPDNLTGSVETFYREVREALRDTGVKLSIATSEAVMLGQDDRSGQTLALLEQYADRVYVPQSSATDYAQLLRNREATPGVNPLTPDRLVYMVPKGTAVDPAASQLILR